MVVLDFLAKWECILLLSLHIFVGIMMVIVNMSVAIPSGLSPFLFSLTRLELLSTKKLRTGHSAQILQIQLIY